MVANNRFAAWTRSRYQRISQVLDEVLELAPESRGAWLDALQRDDPETGAALRELLEPGEGRLARILADAGELSDRLATLPEAPRSLVGRRFGPYCVRSLLGHGGMGSVWLAERVDGLFARQVALKLVHPALMSMGLTERLSRERAILASLDHPNIARLYDAGPSEDGQPYLALEYVAGTPFGTYCDDRRLGVRERLELFRQVLSAVRYAHAHLVIHRDLKPSNILVTEEGRVCLLDFGIAKLFSDGVAQETELTRLTGCALSLDYAAPEQISGTSITIAADIYSLGVMLYELLSGQGPYKLTRRSRATLEEAILRAEPLPLTRLVASGTAANARATTVKKLSRTVRGDLDTIALKALRKSPAERYATVDALAEDIARWLHGEPILARRDRLAYRAMKFARRHWVAVVVTAAFILTLVGGLAATTYEARVAEEQRDALLRMQLRSLTQTAAARLREGDAATAIGIILEVLRYQDLEGADAAEALAVFHEARVADTQILAINAKADGPAALWSSVDFSPDGHRIVTSSSEDIARIWDAATGHELLSLQGRVADLNGALFAPGGQRILTGSRDHSLRIWSAVSGRELLELKGHTDRVLGAAFSPDGRRVVTASEDHTARIWDAVYGRQTTVLVHAERVWEAEFSPDGRYVATASPDRTARVWDVSTGGQSLLVLEHPDEVIAAAFSPDGRRILTGSFDRTAVIWDAQTARRLVTLHGHTDRIWDVAFSPDGRRVVTASRDLTARVWDATTGQELMQLIGHTSGVRSASFSPDGRRIVTAAYDKTARLWDATSGRELLRLTGHSDEIQFAAFSPDSRRVVTASNDKSVRIWDATSGRELMRFEGHAFVPLSAAFSPDGRRLVIGSDDNTAHVWDAATGEELLQLRGHKDIVIDAEYSPDGRRIVTASRDRSVRVWDAATGSTLMLYEGHGDEVGTVAFSPDGNRLISASLDKTARVWDARILTLEHQVAWAEAAQFEALSPSARLALGVPAARAWLGYRKPAESREPDALARLAEEADEAALVAKTDALRNAHLLDAFKYFAAAAARAQSEGWSDGAWRRWRYRRASLARVLARAGMMEQVAESYESVRMRNTPQPVTF